jgi:hypothetical protein
MRARGLMSQLGPELCVISVDCKNASEAKLQQHLLSFNVLL